MKRFVYLLLAVLLLAGCVPAVGSPASTVTAVTSATTTVAPVPSSTNLSTTVPIIPTATITPMAAVPVPASPLTLTELNAGMEMKRLNVIGTGTPHAIEFSPNGKLLAVATGRGVYLYDGTTFERTSFIDVNDSVSAIAFSSDGDALAVAVNGKASLWNVLSGQKLLDFDDGMIDIAKLAYGRGGYVAAIGGDCRGCGEPVGAMILWNAKTGRRIYVQREIWYGTTALTFNADGTQLIFGGKQGATAIESSTGKLVRLYGGVPGANAPYNLMFSNDGAHFIISTNFFDEFTTLADTATREEVRLSHCGLYFTRATEIGACSNEKSIILIDGVNGQKIKSFDIDVDADTLRNKFALSPDGRFLAYYGKHGIYILETATGHQIATLDFTDFISTQVGIAEIDGVQSYIAAVKDPAGQIVLMDLQSGHVPRTFKLDCCQITGFALAPNRKNVAAISEKILYMWDMSTQQVIYEWDLGKDYSGAIAFSSDGSKVYLTSFEDDVWEINLQTNQRKELGRTAYAYKYTDPFAADNYPFNNLGHLVLLEFKTINGEYIPIFRDTLTNETINLGYHAVSDADFPETFAMSSDGKYIAFGTAKGIYVWDALTARQLWRLDKHEWRSGDGWIGAIKSLIFNPQSDLLVSVGWDETTRLWNVNTGNELRTLHVCCSASFTPDGRYLVTAGEGVIRVWGIPQ